MSYSAPTYSTTYIRDDIGRIEQKTETIGGATNIYNYEYDDVGRLWQVKKDGAVTSTYGYDDNSNRISHNSISATYDSQDRMRTYGNHAFTYNANGDLASKTDTTTNQITTYSYDEFGNLRQTQLGDGTFIEFIIDGQNRRVGKKVNGQFQQGFLYLDQLNPVAELDASGQIVSVFVYGTKPNIPDYMIKSGESYRIFSDHLGSPRLVIKVSNNQIVQRMDYDEFGNVLVDTNPGFQPFGFAGGIYDAQMKLVRFGARDYDPETGRWTSKDPILFAGGDMNLYGYVLRDPVNAKDPSGLIGPSCELLGTCPTDARSWRPGEWPRYGKWCGLNWCGGQRPSDHDGQMGSANPIDDLDNACKKHDQCYDDGGDASQCDKRLVDDLKKIPDSDISKDVFRDSARWWFE